MSYAGAANALIKAVRDYKGAAINLVIVGGTITLKKVVQKEGFHCPCVSPAALKGCVITSEYLGTAPSCTQKINFYYGVSLILFPAIFLFFVGMLVMPRLWKIVTGCLKLGPRQRKRRGGIVSTLVTSFIKALLAPLTWIIVMLLDGKYLACAITSLPYDVGPDRTYETCTAVSADKLAPMSDSFDTNVIVSQILGWFLLALLTCVGFIGYALISSNSKLTYYHAKYFKIYRENEEYEIDDEMKIKAQLDAEANVKQFMEMRRDKEEWDEISQVYEYQKDHKNLSVYSYLHKWVLRQQRKAQQGEDGDIETDSDDAGPGHSLAWRSLLKSYNTMP